MSEESDTLAGTTSTTSYSYDPAGRLLGLDQASGATSTATYDPAGDPTTLTNGTTESFGASGELTSSTTSGPDAASTTYGYDATGDCTTSSTTTAGGETTTTDGYTYDAEGELTSAGTTAAPPGPPETTLVADPYGYDTYAITPAGTLGAWGEGTQGQLGDGTEENSSAPVQVSGLSGVESVAAEEGDAAAVANAGQVYAWGEDDTGVLGPDAPAASDTALQVEGISGATEVALGYGFGLALLQNGTVSAWGTDRAGELGQGTETSAPSGPVTVPGLSGVTEVAAGYDFALALTASGAVYEWGDGANGVLGQGPTANEDSPTLVAGLPPVRAISCGYDDAGAVADDGSAWLWGDDDAGQTGAGALGGDQDTPAEVPGTEAAGLSLGYQDTLVLTTTGALEGLGDASHGQLGAATGDQDTPVALPGVADPTSFSAGKGFVEWLGPTATPYGLGTENDGALGDDASGSTLSTDTEAEGALTPTGGDIASGSDFTIAAKADGTLWAWGGNEDGQLGQGSSGEGSQVPVEVGGVDEVSEVAAGNAVALAVTSSGAVYAMGDGSWGVTGTGEATGNLATPTQVEGLPAIAEVKVGSGFALALDTTGRIWRWGQESDGQLGGNTGTTSTAISAPIGPSIADIVAIAAGGHHGLALQAEGSGGDTVFGWGENTSGQLGLGTTTDTSRAQAVPGITSAVAIAAGAQSSYVLSATGSVYAMGSDASGQLPGAQGTTESPELLAAPLGGGTTVAIAASGEDFYQEEDQNGSLTLYGYGDDASGQLGEPTASGGVSDLGEDPVSLSAGPTHLAALAEDGDADSLGDNAAGEAGNATVTSTDTFAAASGFSAAAQATSTSVTDYAYDGQGIRRTSSTAGQTTTFSYWGAGDEPELLSDGTNDYLYGPNGEVDEQVSVATGQPTFLVHDQLGSTRLITDASGNVVGTATYDAYGNLTEHTGTATSPIGYAGGYTDPTGLLYLLHRYYDPQTGEFLSVDPDVEETDQPYVYGGDDPVDESDPSGNSPQTAPIGALVPGPPPLNFDPCFGSATTTFSQAATGSNQVGIHVKPATLFVRSSWMWIGNRIYLGKTKAWERWGSGGGIVLQSIDSAVDAATVRAHSIRILAEGDYGNTNDVGGLGMYESGISICIVQHLYPGGSHSARGWVESWDDSASAGFTRSEPGCTP